MKNVLFRSLFLTLGLAASDASAAGNSIPDFSWSRCYGGLSANFSSSHSKTQIPWPAPVPIFLPSGPMHAAASATGFGVQTGCNKPIARHFLLGLEGEISVSGLAEKLMRAGSALPPTPPQLIYRRSENLQFGLAARAGMVFDRSLVFVKTGIVFSDFDYAIPASGRHGGCGVGPCPPAANLRPSSDMFRAGLLLGGGLEYALTNSWTVKAEYHRTWSGRRFAGAGATTRLRTFETRDVVKVGLNFLFDGPGPWSARN